MIRIYDCSNSPESEHGKLYGPIDKDIIVGLKNYSRQFDSKFVNSMADIIITNDIFINDVKEIDIPKIKTIDKVHWNNNYTYKNKQLNESAELADHVIFTSEFNRQSLRLLYPEVKIKSSSVILDTADNKIFKPTKQKNVVSSVVANCKDWNKEEKRFKSLMQFARVIPDTLYLIGNCDMEVPPNVVKLGYISDYGKINEILNSSEVFINLSYRETPMVVCQAVAAGLPILYADSGGVSELVDYGVSIKDEKEIFFSDEVPELDTVDILRSYNELKNNYNKYKGNVKRNHLAMITNYYKIITEYVGNK